jgi:uncharacterized RDD family membrane protein YckC
VSRLANQPEIRERQGTRAGIVSRALADAVDLVALILIGLIVLISVSAIYGLFTKSVEFVSFPQGSRGALATILFIAYLGYGWGLEGRTLGKTVMGLRVVRDDGSDLSPGWGLLRAVLYLFFLPGFLWAAVSGRNASLQDLVLRTSVVYDWGFGEERPEPGAAPVGEARTDR